MPKRVHEIKGFHKGTITFPSDTDIDNDAASYSLNVDPMQEDGSLKGIQKDKEIPIADSTSDKTTIDGTQTRSTSTLNVADNASFASSGIVVHRDSNGDAQSSSYTGKATDEGGDDSLTGVSQQLVGSGNYVGSRDLYEGATTFNADKIEMINDAGTRHIAYFDDADDYIKKIENLYSSTVPPTKTTLSTGTESVTGLPSMVKNNKEIHIGMGNGSANKPRWCGIISHGQFGGSAPSGLQLKDAELDGPTLIPNFHKAVDSGSYIYGVEWGGNKIYKLLQSDYSLYETKMIIPQGGDLPQFSALAKASDGNLWAFSLTKKAYSDSGTETLGEWYKISATTLEILLTGTMTVAIGNGFTTYGYKGPDSTPGSGDKWVVTDMIEIGDYLWFGGSVGITGNAQVAYDKNWLLNQDKANFLQGATVSVNRRSFNTEDGGNNTQGYFYLGYSTGPLFPTAIIPPICLVDPKHGSGSTTSSGNNEYCGVVMEWYHTDGSTSLHDHVSHGLRGASNAVKNIGTAIMSIKYDQTQTANISNWVTWRSGINDCRTTSGKIIGVSSCGNANIYSVVNSSTSYYTDLYSHVAYDHNTDYTSDNQTISMIDATETQDINRGVTVIKDNSSQVDIHIFSGSGVGRWMTDLGTANAGTFTVRLESSLEVVLAETGVDSSLHTSGRKYYYKASYVYDGFQESPLSDMTVITSTGKQVEVEVRIHDTSGLSSRVSHINLYMADSAGDAHSPEGFYRYVTTFDLDKTWNSIADPAQAPDWGSYYNIFYNHSSRLTASYEARVGISEVLDSTMVNYGISAELNSQLFVARCYHKDVTDASNYLFKSKPYNYDQFDWTTDLLILPTYPTAIASFNGRIYVFDENNMYRIEPNNMYIEDVKEGVGCLSQYSVCVTDYGMCFADKHYVYLFDGNQTIPISMKISKGGSSSDSWDNLDTAHSPRIAFHNKLKSFLITFKNSTTYYVWAYNVVKRRWDYWRPFSIHGASDNTAEPKGFFYGKDGEVLFSCNNNMYDMLADSTNKRSFDWYSKQLTLGQDTQVKRFNNFSLTGSPSGSLGTNVSIKIDDTAVTESANDGGSGYTNFIINTKSGKTVQWLLSSQSGTVDALGVVYRRKVPNAETAS